MKDYKLKKDHVLVVRTCKADMTAYGGFRWPESGEVIAPDWSPEVRCGSGLHGWLWGVGNYSARIGEHDRKWLVVEVREEGIVDLDGKVKFEKGNVIFCGPWIGAFELAREHMPRPASPESSAAGNSGHASATGNSGHASATGDYGHASAAGNYGHASATGDYGHASATGHSGHASATGYSGHASATGDYGIGCALGNDSRVRAGENGAVIATYWCEEAERRRVVVGYVGEDGIKADTWYVVRDGKLMEVE